MTLEEAKELLSFVYAEYADKSTECACKYNDFETANYFDDRCKAIKTVLKALDNSISKDEVKRVYKDYYERIKCYDDNNIERDDTYYEYVKICDVLLIGLLGE